VSQGDTQRHENNSCQINRFSFAAPFSPGMIAVRIDPTESRKRWSRVATIEKHPGIYDQAQFTPKLPLP
jgi:hypothetical protein